VRHVFRSVTTAEIIPDLAACLAPVMKDLEANQKPERLHHIYGVIQASISLADLHGVDKNQAALAAALHDCAKHVGREETLDLVQSGAIKLSSEDQNYPAIWHGPVAAYFAKSRYGVTDSDVLDAVEHHTLGHSSPGRLLQVLMCADATEPTRDYPGLEELRAAVRADLKSGLLSVLKHKMCHIMERGQQPHSRMSETIKSLEN